MDRQVRRGRRPSGRRRPKPRGGRWKLLAAAAVVALLVWAVVALCGSSQPEQEKERTFTAKVEGSGTPSQAASQDPSQASSQAIPALAPPTLPTPSPEPENAQLSDPLLVLVNDETPLPDDWQVDLSSISGEEWVDSRIYDDLNALVNAAAEEDIWFWIASGYRSVEDQETILQRGIQRRMDEEGMSEEEAREDALRTIQRPGYSEHHTGLAVDFNDVSEDFENTAEYQWLCQHAAEYGFVQRYRLDKVALTGIDNESWHYRYVGKEHAREMERLDMCLEEYVAYRKEQGDR